ncbi:hypothetical protein FOL47_004519 [Perkinsus chesapeaki]|uniref:Uncharacterized protein n=1 Tax=Perkinsus chesapeaki TaxID=330153 RepID=A0A7J6M379_PERCH|nr:hypothetical protein FOL47_004519 [Perkinsus chesapeaki]
MASPRQATTALYKVGVSLAIIASIAVVTSGVLNLAFLKKTDQCSAVQSNEDINCKTGILLTAVGVTMAVTTVLLITLVWLSANARSDTARVAIVFLCIVLFLCGAGSIILLGINASSHGDIPIPPGQNTVMGILGGLLGDVGPMIVVCSPDTMTQERLQEIYSEDEEDDGEVEGKTWKEFFDEYKEEEEKDNEEYQQLLSRQKA